MHTHTQIHMQQLGRGCGSLEWLNLLFVNEEKAWENQTNRTPEVRGSLYPKSDGEHISSIPTFFVTLPACWPPGPLFVLHSENDLIFQLPSQILVATVRIVPKIGRASSQAGFSSVRLGTVRLHLVERDVSGRHQMGTYVMSKTWKFHGKWWAFIVSCHI